MDWIITTPILLLELCILSNIKNSKIIITILCVNFLTFAFGWLGEVKFLSRWKSCILAFIPFLFLFFTMDNVNAFAGVALSATVFCGVTLFLSWIWIVYRAIRGIIVLNDDQALPL